MRLTLRTMLAYLDNVLEPSETEALGAKINESDFASGLVQRIRVVMKKLRMDAPKVDGKGMGNDANTVSEYLDSTLPQDRVGDFERVCLESDKHLCEVAACHQILTIVLGKPADVPPDLRERIYNLPHPEKHPVNKSAVVTPPPVQTAVAANGRAASKPVPEVPEYLRAGRRSSLVPLLAVVAATFLIAIGGLWMIGAFKPSHPLMKALRGGPQVAAKNSAADNSAANNSAANNSAAAPVSGSRSTASTEPATEVEASADSTPKATSATKTSDNNAAKTVTPAASTAAAENSPPQPALPAVPAADVAAAPAPVAPLPAIPAPDANPPVAAAPAAGGAPATGPAPLPAIPPPETAVADAGKTPRRPLVPPPPEVKPPPMDVGRYTSDGQVLATFDAADGLWKLKPPLGALLSGERLVALPTYRPQLTLPGVQVTFAGEGEAEMAPPADGNVSRLIVDHGRFLVVAVGAMNSQLDLDLGGVAGAAGIRGVVTLVDADSALAVKVVRWLPPGMNPAEGPGAIVVELFNTRGRVTWQESGQPKIEIPTHQAYVYAGANAPELQGPYLPPEWIDAKSVAPIDRQASLELDGLVARDRPLGLSLQEAHQHRKVEVRSLAARCLASLNEFEPTLKEMSDARQYSYWIPEIDALRHALHHSPERAAAVKSAIERLRAADAKVIFDLIVGFNQEQLERGGAALLVKLLEHDQMDVRVLAHYNLMAITGASEFYRPDRPPSGQQKAIQNWKERLAKGTIAYKLPPTPLENYRPLVNPAAEAPPRAAP